MTSSKICFDLARLKDNCIINDLLNSEQEQASTAYDEAGNTDRQDWPAPSGASTVIEKKMGVSMRIFSPSNQFPDALETHMMANHRGSIGTATFTL